MALSDPAESDSEGRAKISDVNCTVYCFSDGHSHHKIRILSVWQYRRTLFMVFVLCASNLNCFIYVFYGFIYRETTGFSNQQMEETVVYSGRRNLSWNSYQRFSSTGFSVSGRSGKWQPELYSRSVLFFVGNLDGHLICVNFRYCVKTMCCSGKQRENVDANGSFGVWPDIFSFFFRISEFFCT